MAVPDFTYHVRPENDIIRVETLSKTSDLNLLLFVFSETETSTKLLLQLNMERIAKQNIACKDLFFFNAPFIKSCCTAI